MAKFPKRKWALWQDKKIFDYVTADFIRVPMLGVVELWSKEEDGKEFLVAVIALSHGQHVSLYDTGVPQ